MSDIAKLAGVGRTAVSNWRRRFNDFPRPTGATTTGDVFDLGQVERWLVDHGKIRRRIPSEEWLWRALESGRRLDTPDRLIEISAALLTFLHVLRTQPTPMAITPWVAQVLRDWPSPAAGEIPSGRLAGALRESANVVEAMSPSLRNVLTPALGQIRPQHEPFLRSLVELAARTSIPKLFEALLERRGRWLGKRVHQSSTSDSLTALLLRLASPQAGTVLDPAAGEGGFLLAAARAAGDPQRLTLRGQEVNAAAWRLAIQRLTIHGLEADIRLGDSLRDDAFPGQMADLVLCDPPYGYRGWRTGLSADDPRWVFGVPGANADFAWVQHVIAHLQPDRRAFILLPVGSLYRGGVDARIRSQLLDQGAVEAVIALPPGLARGTSIALALWVVRTPTATQRVLLIEASDHQEGTSSPQQPDARCLERIEDVWDGWTQNPQGFTDIPGVAAAIPVSKLLEAEGTLVPARWIPSADHHAQPSRVARQATNAKGELRARVAELAAVDDDSAFIGAADASVQRWRVRDLVADGRASLLSGTRIRAEDMRPYGIPVLGAAELRADGSIRRHRFVDLDQLPAKPLLTEPGDIVILAEGNRTRAVVDEQGGAVISAPCQGLRLNDNRFDPYVTAAFLQAKANARFSGGVTFPHTRLQDLELPRLSPDETRELSAFLRALSRQRRLALETVQAADELAQQVIDGIADGALQVVAQTRSHSASPK
jgi:hypothetical protein